MTDDPLAGINPSLADVGRAVVYRAPPAFEPEQGVITALRLVRGRAAGAYIFVRYGRDQHSKLTPLARLEWIS